MNGAHVMVRSAANPAPWAGPRVEFRQFRFDQPIDLHVHDAFNMLAYFAPPEPSVGEIFCPQAGMRDFAPAPSARFRPSNVDYHVRGLRGEARILRCRFNDADLEAITETPVAWTEEEIARGLDLSHTRINTLLAKVAAELAAPALGTAALVEAATTMIMVELVRHMKRAEVRWHERGRLAPRLLDRIRERAERDEGPLPSVGELARMCDMSERNLLRLFRASQGETISSYLRRVQLDRARRYLMRSDRPLKDIAWRLGFAQPSGFIAAFRRTTGETPDQFRRRLRRDPAGASIPEGD